MAVRSGFWDSIGGDRTYSAEDMGTLFDGIINDGVFAAFGDAFRPGVNAEGTKITVGTGRAWRAHRWAWHESAEELDFDFLGNTSMSGTATVLVSLVWRTENTRRNVVFDYQLTSTPLQAAQSVYENTQTPGLPLFYVTMPAGTAKLDAGMIVSLIGGAHCPWVSAPVQSFSTDDLRARWNRAYTEATESVIREITTSAQAQTAQLQGTFDAWFAGVQATLDGNVAGNLANQIDAIKTQLDTLVSSGAVETPLEFAGSNGLLSNASTSAGGVLTATTIFTPLV